MRDFLELYVNGRPHRITGSDVFTSLTAFLRRGLSLVGTKVVCSEGDCGACTVLLGRLRGDKFRYQIVDACIQFLFQLDGCHVVTVEGLARDGELNQVQQALIDCHGSQCGFCTPGFVMSLTGQLEEKTRLSDHELRYALAGNLCRCTGYAPILAAGLELTRDESQAIGKLYPSESIRTMFPSKAGSDISICDGEAGHCILFSPVNLRHAITFLVENPQAQIVAGATDLGVQINKGLISPHVVLDLNRIRELKGVEIVDGELWAGACASWSEIECAVESIVPQFHHILTLFGAPQIRNVGTIGGNIANASPIADSLPFLFVCEAEVQLSGPDGDRWLNINQLYLGYKQLDLRPGELITRVRIPLPAPESLLRLYKISRRRDLDIASFTAAILLRLQAGHIESAAIAFGAVGPTVIRARNTELFLTGRPFSEQAMREAGEVAMKEIRPLSDVRGELAYRLQLARNVLLKCFHESNAA